MKNLLIKLAKRIGIIKEPPHICHYEFKGFASHFGQIVELDSPSQQDTRAYFFPPVERRKQWLESGYTYAHVYQSKWQCNCGKSEIFFFLSKPIPYSYYVDKNADVIAESYMEDVKRCYPFDVGAVPGKTVAEVTRELTRELFE